MDRKQLIRGIICVGAGILLLLLAGEILDIDPSGALTKGTSLIIRFVSYIFIVVGVILGISSTIPKK